MTISKFVQRMIFANQLTMEDGYIELLGFRMAMLPTHTLTKLIEELYEVHGEEAFDIMFRVGKHHGHYATNVLGKRHDIPRRQFVSETLESAGILGLGQFESDVLNFDEGKLVFRIEDSPFPEKFRDSDVLSDIDHPVDHLQRGMFHAIAEDMFDAQVISREPECEFLGSSHCKLIAQTTAEEPAP